jgi:hypothetical protein
MLLHLKKKTLLPNFLSFAEDFTKVWLIGNPSGDDFSDFKSSWWPEIQKGKI